MVRKTIALFGVMAMWTLVGCQSRSDHNVAMLQEQLRRIEQQLIETKKQVDGLQDANQRTTKTLYDLEASFQQFNVAAPTPVSTRPVVATVKPASPVKSTPVLLAKPEERPTPPVPTAVRSTPSAAAKATPPAPPSRLGKPKEVFVVSKEPVRTEPAQSKTPSPVVQNPATLATEDLKPAAPKQMASVDSLCTRVWKQLSAGKTHEEAADSLGVAVSYVAACERRGGQGGGR